MNFVKTLCKSIILKPNAENLIKHRHICLNARRLAIQKGQAVDAQESSGANVDYVHAEEKRPYHQASWDTSIRYMESSAYNTTYGDDAVWKNYRRNFKGSYAPRTRESCVRHGILNTGSSCPICRDELLKVDYRNLKLLKQFLNPYTGELLDSRATGVCQKQHKELELALEKAVDYGFIHMKLEHKHYDYDIYRKIAKQSMQTNNKKSDNTNRLSQEDSSAVSQDMAAEAAKASTSSSNLSSDPSKSPPSTAEMSSTSDSSDSSSSDEEFSSSDEETDNTDNKPNDQNKPEK